MPRIPDKRFWFDFYFMMGSYAMCINSLFRNDEQIKSGLQYAVFPSLHKVSDGYVATMLSKSTRKSLISQICNGIKKDQNNLPLSSHQKSHIEEWSKLFSSKSIRNGGVNDISIHAMIYIFQSCALTGKYTGTYLDSYPKSLNPLKGLPGAHSLHENKHIHVKVVSPDIGMIGSMNQAAVEYLIQFIPGAPTIK